MAVAAGHAQNASYYPISLEFAYDLRVVLSESFCEVWEDPSLENIVSVALVTTVAVMGGAASTAIAVVETVAYAALGSVGLVFSALSCNVFPEISRGSITLLKASALAFAVPFVQILAPTSVMRNMLGRVHEAPAPDVVPPPAPMPPAPADDVPMPAPHPARGLTRVEVEERRRTAMEEFRRRQLALAGRSGSGPRATGTPSVTMPGSSALLGGAAAIRAPGEREVVPQIIVQPFGYTASTPPQSYPEYIKALTKFCLLDAHQNYPDLFSSKSEIEEQDRREGRTTLEAVRIHDGKENLETMLVLQSLAKYVQLKEIIMYSTTHIIPEIGTVRRARLSRVIEEWSRLSNRHKLLIASKLIYGSDFGFENKNLTAQQMRALQDVTNEISTLAAELWTASGSVYAPFMQGVNAGIETVTAAPAAGGARAGR